LRGAQVLLTGASGSLGAALLEPLLCALGPEGRVHCLVRRPDALGQRAEPRVVTHVGDVSDVRLGLAADTYARLAVDVGVVIHLAARLSAAAPAASLRQVNVEGTRQVLRFAATGSPKALLYASSLSVFADALPRPARCTEDLDLDATERAVTPYAASKWSAERLVQASDAGAGAATVVRLGLLTGTAETGHGAPMGHLARVVRGLAALGALPQMPEDAAAALRFDVTPVDHAASTCLALLTHDLARGQAGTYHVAAARPATLQALTDALCAEGVALSTCTWPDLCRRAGRLRDPSGDAALALLSLCRADPAAFERHRGLDLFAATGTHFSLVNTQRALSGTSYVAPAPSATLLRRYVRSALT
jgi:thioester reductase-like protein